MSSNIYIQNKCVLISIEKFIINYICWEKEGKSGNPWKLNKTQIQSENKIFC